MKLEPIKILLAWATENTHEPATENTHEPVSTALTPKKKTPFFFFCPFMRVVCNTEEITRLLSKHKRN